MSDSPVRGRPEEFAEVEELFRQIHSRTDSIEVGLNRIADGTSEHFGGEAADTFQENIRAIAPQLAEVPDIARQLTQIFRNHKHQLQELHREARGAVARYEANWNEYERAKSVHEHLDDDLRSIERRLRWLFDDDERYRLEDRRADLALQERRAQTRRSYAENAWQDSQDKLGNLEREEKELNKRTAKSLRDVDVGALKDPGQLERLLSLAIDFAKALVTLGPTLGPIGLLLSLLPTEVLKLLHEVLNGLSGVLTVIGVILVIAAAIALIVISAGAATPFLVALGYVGVTALAVNSVKFSVGRELYLRGEYTLQDVISDGIDVLLSAIGVALGGGGPMAKSVRELLSREWPTVVSGAKFFAEEYVEQQSNGDDEAGVPVDWGEYRGEFPKDTANDGGTMLDDASMSRVPNFDLPTICVAVPAVSVDAIGIDLGPLDGLDIADIEMPDSVADVTADFDGSFSPEDWSLSDFTFSGLADFVYDNPQAVPDLSDLEMIDLEAGFDWHFEFSPPETILAGFGQALEDLKLQLAPSGLDS